MSIKDWKKNAKAKIFKENKKKIKKNTIYGILVNKIKKIPAFIPASRSISLQSYSIPVSTSLIWRISQITSS